MMLNQVCDFVAEHGVSAIRQRKGETGAIYDCKQWFTGAKRGWVAVDAFSASAFRAVYAAVNEENRAKLNALPPVKAFSVCFKLVK